MPKPLIIVPSYNSDFAATRQLVSSLRCQSVQKFRVIFAIDNCLKSYLSTLKVLNDTEPTFEYVVKPSARRRFALGNIVATIFTSQYLDTSWVGILDGDDHLLTPNVIETFNAVYQQGAHVAWSNFLWDGNPSNVSRSFPQNANPYLYPWVSSHFKTFSYQLFLSVPVGNYLDADGRFFRRCYDHALMLPLLWLCSKYNLATKYIPQPLYYYNNTNSSIPASEHTKGTQENSIAHFIRSRGYIS